LILLGIYGLFKDGCVSPLSFLRGGQGGEFLLLGACLPAGRELVQACCRRWGEGR